MKYISNERHLSLKQEAIFVNLSFWEKWVSRCFKSIRKGQLLVKFPAGVEILFKGSEAGPSATLVINNFRFALLTLISGDLGFAESFMRGDWETDDLSALLMLGALNEDPLSDIFKTGWLSKLLNRFDHLKKANTKRGSTRNIAAHYDLGNDFYKIWLKGTMTYSSALFKNPNDSMVRAQRQKYLRLAEKLELKPGDSVLEIGCGWGDFAEIAAVEFGCQVLGITLSCEQAKFARERFKRAGLEERIKIEVIDYRDLLGQFDKVVSIEMFEAVGQEYWGAYFEVLQRSLKPNGRAGLQVITISDQYFDTYRKNPDFIQRYIFPGGMLPSKSIFEKAVNDAGLLIHDSFYFGKSYAETLRCWRREFLGCWPQITKLGFDDRFKRMWKYYLSYCEVGFDNGQTNVGQFVIQGKLR